MKRGKGTKKLNETCLKKGWTMRLNINPELMTAIKEWNKESASKVNEAIKSGDVKEALKETKNARNRRKSLRNSIEEADRIIYDASGNAIYWYETKTDAIYTLEPREGA